MRKSDVKDLTYGALISAILGVLIAISNLSATAYDSFMFYIIPVPIAIYAYLKDYKWGILVILTSTIVAFLIQTNPINVLIITIPNLLLGYLFGLLKKKINNILLLLITFLLAILTNILAILSLQIVSNINFYDYFISGVADINNLFKIDTNIFKTIIMITIPAFIILDSLIKSVFIYIIFCAIIRALKIDMNITLKINTLPKRSIGLISLLALVLMILLFRFSIQNESLIIIAQIAMIIFTIIAIYILFMFVFYLERLCIFTNHKNLIVLVLALSILLFPITILAGIFYNLAYEMFPVY